MSIFASDFKGVYSFDSAKNDLLNYIGPFHVQKSKTDDSGFYYMLLVSLGMELERCKLSEMMFFMATNNNNSTIPNKINKTFIHDYINSELMGGGDEKLAEFGAIGKNYIGNAKFRSNNDRENEILFSAGKFNLKYNIQVNYMDSMQKMNKQKLSSVLGVDQNTIMKCFVQESLKYAEELFIKVIQGL